MIGGNFAAKQLETSLGIKPLGALVNSAFTSPPPDFIALGGAALQPIALQYVCLLLPAFALGWWRRRLPLAHYGVTRAGQSLGALLALGALCFAAVTLPNQVLWLAKPVRQVLAGTTWTFSFWVFFGVVSFGILPLLEELFFRGYCQTRLEESFGGIGAIVIVALFTTLAHDQYHRLSALSIGTILALLPIALGAGYVFWRSRSLVPAMIIHMGMNVPTTGIFDFLVPGLMALAVVLFRRRVMEMMKTFCQAATERDWKVPALLATAFAVALIIGFEHNLRTIVPIALLGLVAATSIEFLQRRKAAHSSIP